MYKVYDSLHDPTRTIRVFQVRHWARRALHADDLRHLIDEPIDRQDDTEK